MTDCAIAAATAVRGRPSRREAGPAGVPAWARFLGVVVLPVRGVDGSTGFVLSAGAGLTNIAAVVHEEEPAPPSMDAPRPTREDQS